MPLAAASPPSCDTDLVARERLAVWLDAHLPHIGAGPLNIERLAGGATNAVFRIDRGGPPVVLRRPPARPRPDSEKIMRREARILAALADTDVPTPRLFALCEDREVIGAVFVVMEFVEGWLCFGDGIAPPLFAYPAPSRASLAFALIDGIAALARVDHKAQGLGDFGKPEGFLERQVDRWLAQLDSYRALDNYEGRVLPSLGYIADWLRANTPTTYRIGVIHGDYGFANAMFAYDAPARLAAIIDWELSTIGAPLLDLAWCVASFRGEPQAPAYFNPEEFPTRAELIAHYEQRTGEAIENFDYFLVLAMFKRAILLERHYARSLTGAQDAAIGKRMGATVLGLLDAASQIARSAP